MSWLATKELDRDGAREEASDEGVDAPGVRFGVAAPDDPGEPNCEPGPCV